MIEKLEAATVSKLDILTRAFTGQAARLWDELVKIYEEKPVQTTPNEKYKVTDTYFNSKRQEIIDIYKKLQPVIEPMIEDKELRGSLYDSFLATPKIIAKEEELDALLWHVKLYRKTYNDLKKQFAPSSSLSKRAKGWVEWFTKQARYVTAKSIGTDIYNELRNYRPDTAVKLYRGIQFGSKVKMVKVGQTLKLKTDRLSSWSYSKDTADRFARYQEADSQGMGMLMWFQQMKEKKAYQGSGGFIVEAIIDPKVMLTDFTKTPSFFSGHGGEGEVVIMPDVTIAAKVIKVIR